MAQDHALTRRAWLRHVAGLPAVLAAARAEGAAPDAPVHVVEAPRLFDGTTMTVRHGARVVTRGGLIAAAGPAQAIPVPAGATVTRLEDGTILPGLIDCHYHIEEDPGVALRQLAHGVTAFRDPGEWVDVHAPLRARIERERIPGPRSFLTGPHLDGERPAYPADAVVVRDPQEARRQVDRAVDAGATAIKIYFRLSLASALAVIAACRRHGIPSTAHLEILDARALLDAGLTGVEHVTSFGTSIASPMAAERYRQAVLADNDARRDGRYALFADADLDGPEARQLYAVVQRTRPFVDATLAVFEARADDPAPKDSPLPPARRQAGFRQMLALVQRLHQHGARIVMGGHTEVPHAGRGEAPWRELELLVDAGLTQSEALTAATRHGAAFLGRGGRGLGALRTGAAADVLLVEGDPTRAIEDLRRVRLVLAAGRPVDLVRLGAA